MLKEAEGWLKGNETILIKAENTLYDKQEIMAECISKQNMTDECKQIQIDGPIKLAEFNAKYNKSFETMDDALKHARNLFEAKKKIFKEKSKELDQGGIKVDGINKHYIWPILNALFVIGGMTGALTSKYVLDYLGRKKGILFNFIFGIAASILVFISIYAKSPGCIIASRFLFGIQGGMACSLV